MRKTFQIAHEAPLSLMPFIRQVTDYDYALVHLFEDKEIGGPYKNFFVESMKMGRKVILDNSIFELGEAFDVGEFFSHVQDLLPTEYIIPDVFQDSKGTLKNVEDWFQLVNDLNPAILIKCKAIGVVQGKTEEECIECYKALASHPNIYKIAIPFDFEWYQEQNRLFQKEIAYMVGRRHFVMKLSRIGELLPVKPLHLLGCALPQEFIYYKNVVPGLLYIESIDTSNPVLHGMEGYRYTDEWLNFKSSTKMATIMEEGATPQQVADVFYNIGKFRESII